MFNVDRPTYMRISALESLGNQDNRIQQSCYYIVEYFPYDGFMIHVGHTMVCSGVTHGLNRPTSGTMCIVPVTQPYVNNHVTKRTLLHQI